MLDGTDKKKSLQSIKKILPSIYENISNNKYPVVKTIYGVSVMDLDIYEVFRINMMIA